MKKRRSKRNGRKPEPFFDKKRRRWIARVHLGGGKYRQRNFAERVDAEVAIDALWNSRGCNEDQQTFGETMTAFLSTYKDGQPKTYDDYRFTAKLLSELNPVLVEQMSTKQVQRALDNIALLPSRKRARTLLGTFFKWAIRRKLAIDDPSKNTDPVSYKKQRVTVFSPDELTVLLGAMNDRWKLPTELMYQMTLRPGELWGLCWKHVHDDHLSIEQAAKEATGKLIIGPPKTEAGRRTLPLDTRAKAILHERRVQALKEGVAGKSLPVFPTKPGNHMRQSSYRKHGWKPAFERAEIEYKTPYTLRHTSATEMLNSGKVSLAAVAKWMGHASPATTLKHYSHLLKNELSTVVKYWESVG